MLDIHEDLSGDISHRLEPYSNKRSVEHFVQFFDVWGLDISRDRTEALVQHLEAFPCADPDERPVEQAPETTSAAQRDPEGRRSPWPWLLAGGAFVPVAAAFWFVARRR